MSNVLLIESDKILASNISEALERAGHKADWQVDPQKALESANVKLPDVIILELMLANRGGVEFLYEFRSYPDWQKIPVVIFSSLSAEELSGTLDGFADLNITQFNYKPGTTLAQLVGTVDKSFKTAEA